jgi:hypothetical protein
MKKQLIIKQLSHYFSVDDLRAAVTALSSTPPDNEALALLSAALRIANFDGLNTEYIWFSAFAAVCSHDSKLAAMLLQTATQINSGKSMRARLQNAFIQDAILSCKLTKADTGRALDVSIENKRTREEVTAELFTHFTIDHLRSAVEVLNKRSPKNEGIDILWAVLQLDPAVDPMQTWFTALALICVHDPALAESILLNATTMSGNPVLNLNKAELIDAIASGSKLTKADAG